MIRQTQQVLLHIIGCVVFLSLPLLFSPESLSLRSYLTNPPTQRDIIVYMLVLGLFYANFYLLIPRLYFRRKYLFYILINIFAFLLITEIPNLFVAPPFRPSLTVARPPANPVPRADPSRSEPAPPGPQYPAPARSEPFPRPNLFWDLNQHLFLFLVVLFLALLLKIRDRWKLAEAEKLHAELAYLKAQVNPHFLFNTLNSIYSLALEKSDRTPDAIVKLASMMRYVLLETSREKVPLEQELAYLSDYVQLQQTRFEGSSIVDLSISGQPEGKNIVPLLLIPFIENAFKHGINPEEPSAILIRIDIRDDQLFLLVTNKKINSPQPTPIPSGLGIQNTRQRLQLLYPARFTLHIDDGVKDFSVSLTLKLIG